MPSCPLCTFSLQLLFQAGDGKLQAAITDRGEATVRLNPCSKPPWTKDARPKFQQRRACVSSAGMWSFQKEMSEDIKEGKAFQHRKHTHHLQEIKRMLV
ncbi:hypothetical protein OJAV_G00047010 [Oryzias javanicus]|uniref:Uncharacterized protein n=1 Tax=Oryzias javanicus TaxID=123683 RepID=A0A3S2MDP0_ORYJA|nr:hypothetical protein OJAV_G00047010 [Oryzias javanicus]